MRARLPMRARTPHTSRSSVRCGAVHRVSLSDREEPPLASLSRGGVDRGDGWRPRRRRRTRLASRRERHCQGLLGEEDTHRPIHGSSAHRAVLELINTAGTSAVVATGD